MISQYVNLYFPACSFITMILLCILYFSKERIRNDDNSIYGKLLVTGLIESFLMLFTNLLVCFIFIPKYYLLFEILNKILYCVYIVWMTLLFFYIFRIGKNKNEKHIITITTIINVILIILIFISPIQLYYNGGLSNSTGMASNVLYVGCSIYLFLMLVYTIGDYKKISNRAKYAPLFLLFILMAIMLIIRRMDPLFNISSNVLSFVLLVMYFTIENPDIKILEQIETARMRAEQANRVKSDFLSSMSHEIKTPLTAIVGFSEDIRDYIDTNDKDRIKEDSDLILSSSETLLEIVGNILDISKIESEKMDIIEIKYNPKEEIEKLAKITSTRIGEKPINFHLSIAENIPYELIGDLGKVKQIVNNFLTNAIKYTEKGDINLNVECINQNNRVLLKISCMDTGMGIKKENIGKLFTEFERLDVEKNSTIEGTGLGLAITKKLVEMMGGAVSVSSTFGKGSIFIAQIPQKISLLDTPKDIVQDKEKIKQELPIVNNSNSVSKILIVDDNKLNIVVAKKALEGLVNDIDTVLSGQECLDKINEERKYDIILMDIMMPGMNGETVLQELKKIEGFNTPVVAVTADTEYGSKEKYLNEGFVDYVAKPFKKEIIRTILDKYTSDSDIETI